MASGRPGATEMDKLSYALCAVTAALCALLLLRAWARSRASLLLWSGLCFVALTTSNVVLVIDRLVVPGQDLSLWRHGITLIGVVLLLGGLIFGSDRGGDRP